MSNKFLFTSTISLLFLTPIAFIGAQLFIRFSYFYIIPIIFNFLYWKKRDPEIIENSSLTKIFIILIGLITYTAPAIENILYT